MMKPMKLSMTAFGPYKEKEVIDFTQLQEEQLFVISGPTGAGKTTVFDAICFALYGSASGSDRQNNQMLRSHFAVDDLHTSVEFIFSIHGKVYRVLRQLGHVKEGNKTATGEKYEFFEQIAEEKEVPAVDRQRVTDINQKIEALIGLTESQFKQIVMLPQGEFLRLLTSETENKEAILRRLFKTEKYQDLNAILQQKKNQMEQHFSSEQRILEHYKGSIPSVCSIREGSSLAVLFEKDTYNISQLLTVLQDEKVFLQEKIGTETSATTKAKQAAEEMSQKWTTAKTINEQFTQLQVKQHSLDTLLKQQEVYKEKENRLVHAKRASQIIPYEEQYEERMKEEAANTIALRKAKGVLQVNKMAFLEAKTMHETEKAKENERETARKKLEQLEGYLPVVQEMDKEKIVLTRLEKDVQEATEAVKKIDETLTVKEQQIAELKETISSKEVKTKDKLALTERRNELEGQYKVYREYLKTKETEQKILREKNKKEQAYLTEKEKYESLEQNWIQNQAVVLASHLHDGEACPVCGSAEHPNKATDQEVEVTKEQLDQMRVEIEKVEAAWRTVERQYYDILAQLNYYEKEIRSFNGEVEHAAASQEQVVTEGKKIRQRLDELEKLETEVEKAKQTLTSTEKSLAQLRLDKEQTEKEAQTKQAAFIRDAATFKERIRQVPEDIRQLDKLQATLQKAQKVKVQLDEAWEKAQINLQETEKSYIEAEQKLKNAQEVLANTEKSVQLAKERFQEILEKSSFLDVATYKQAKMSEQDRIALEQTIDTYKKEVTSLQTEVRQLSESVKDKKFADLDVLKSEVDRLKKMYEELFVQLQATKNAVERLDDLMENLATTYAKIEKFEKELAVVDDLYGTLRGQNDSRISFERYLQIDYLEQITVAANERFRPLTNNQYELVRSERQETHGRQSGLSLDVHDAYTGQMRDVKTLSGGEKFIASLCLALGMSDVIQSFQGGIHIDTMFIDEGFGTLDEESLNQAIDALIGLQESGRMIGVISHVEELKTIFPAMLEVTKTKEGYSKTNFILK